VCVPSQRQTPSRHTGSCAETSHRQEGRPPGASANVLSGSSGASANALSGSSGAMRVVFRDYRTGIRSPCPDPLCAVSPYGTVLTRRNTASGSFVRNHAHRVRASNDTFRGVLSSGVTVSVS